MDSPEEKLRLIFPYQLFRSYDEAAAHFKKHWRDDDGKTYSELIQAQAWPPATMLKPNSAIFDGETWLLAICLQKKLTSNEFLENERNKEKSLLAQRIAQSIRTRQRKGKGLQTGW